MIHSLCVDPTSKEVSEASVGAACDIAEYFKAQARKILPHLANTTTPRRERRSAHDKCEAEILGRLAKTGKCKKRELQRSGNASAVIFNETLEALVKAGRITCAEGKMGEATGIFYELCDEE